MNPTTEPPYDLVGVGIGPSNLSVAALLEPVDGIRAVFFDRRPEFVWHPGLMFAEATIQNVFLKDLVTLAAPSSPHSFLSFLHHRGRLYRFISARLPPVKRSEFDQYYRWVAGRLDGLHFGCEVERLDHDGERFVVEAGGRRVRARNLLLGTGLEPRIPAFARRHVGTTVFHAARYLEHGAGMAGKRVAIVGGGQSGAEVFQHLLADAGALPRRIDWIARRNSFLPLDASPFTEEIFTPAYSDYFFALAEPVRERLLKRQTLASDGISMDLLEAIYRRLYDLEFNERRGRPWRLHPACEMLALEPAADGWTLEVANRQVDRIETLRVDRVVLATGFRYRVPAFLDPLRDRIELDGDRFTFRDDFSIAWEGEARGTIYVQNAARHCRGVPDPNLSLMAWRAARIVNSLAGRRVYEVDRVSSVFDWRPADEELEEEGEVCEPPRRSS